MSKALATEDPLDSAFVCDCGEEMHPACAGEPFYKAHEGRRYCVLHFPGKEKSASFNKALKRKLKTSNFDFRGVWFPDEHSFRKFRFKNGVNFSYAVFEGEVDFSHAKFDLVASFRFARFNAKVSFRHAGFAASADFRDTAFSAEADFSNVAFGAHVYFTRASFGANSTFTNTDFGTRAFFTNAIFNGPVNFVSAAFTERAYFMKTTIRSKAYFTYTSFESYVLFSGAEDKSVFTADTSLDFQFARLEKPERVSFHTLRLRPHWFVNMDTRRLDFINVDWDWSDARFEQEIESLKRKNISAPHRLLAITYRNFAVNAEENHRYEEASRFRYWSMDVQRKGECRGFEKFRSLGWWYWAASGYGERILRAFAVLFVIWLVFAGLYMLVGFERWEPRRSNEREAMLEQRDAVGKPLEPPRAFMHSLGVMTFQKPEPRPATTAAQSLVIFETILGPLQAALLALAIRRKFMR